MPISAPPAITPAQIGSWFWTRIWLTGRLVDPFHVRSASQKNSAPRNMARQVLNGITAARPMPTPESQKRPLVATRSASRAMPEHGPDQRRPACRHWQVAEPLGQQLGDRLPDGGRGHGILLGDQLLGPLLEKHEVEDGHGDQRAGEDPQHVADGLLARLGAEHVAGLDVHQQVRGVAGHLGR